MDWHAFLLAIGLLLVFEGIMPFVNPSGLRKVLQQVNELSDTHLRYLGLGSMIAGLLLLMLVR